MARYVRTQTIEHQIGAAGLLSLRVTSADVRVRGVDGETATLRATFEIPASSEADADATFEKVRLLSATSSGELRVEEPDGTPSLGGVIGRLIGGRGDVDFDVEIELPRVAELRLETVSGDVTADAVHGEQRYTTVSGDLFLNDTGGSLRVNTVSGDVVVRAERSLAARVNAVSGDLSLAAPRIESFRAQTVSGDVEVEGQLGGGDFRVETVSGDFGMGLIGPATFEVRGISTDISSDLDHRVEGRSDRRRVIVGSGGPPVVFSSMSGDLSVQRPRRVSAEAARAAAPAERITAGDELAVLQALERGEIDVDEAARRLGGVGGDA